MTDKRVIMAETFVQLADTLVDDFDVIDLLTVLTDRCVAILDAGGAGILLAGLDNVLQVVAASSEQTELLELFQLQNQEGPCLDCYVTGQAVVNEPLDNGQWPEFAPVALASGFRSVHAFPMRLRQRTVGALNLFLDDRAELAEQDIIFAQALADVATISVLQDVAARQAKDLAAQLQGALRSRIVIEQAKGVLAERTGIDMDEAFSRLRRHARTQNLRLGDLATGIVTGTISTDPLNAG